MSVRRIKTLNSNQLGLLHKSITGEILAKQQREYDNNKYPIKSPGDKLECKICGGKYTRRNKSIHCNTKHHTKKVDEIYDNIDSLLNIKKNKNKHNF